MSVTDDPPPRRLADRLRETRSTTFTGRDPQLDEFRTALAGTPGAPVLLYLEGPAGIGKSALLRRFTDMASAAGRPAIEVDGTAVTGGPAAFEAEAAGALTADRPVLLIDAFEHCQGLERWLRERFLPRLPDGAVVVLAGRRPLDLAWRTDPGWFPLVRVLSISGLTPAESAELLCARGVPPEQQPPLIAYANGHPLALSLAAEVTLREGVWQPSQDVTSALLRRLIEDVPSPAHRQALHICAHARGTTEALLRAALPDRDTEPIFRWLRVQPYIEEGRDGLRPHDMIRDVLDTDLRWRDPEQYRAMHRRMLEHLVQEVRTAAPGSLLHRVDAVNYLHRNGRIKRRYYRFTGCGEVTETPVRPGDRTALLDLTRRAEGPESVTLVDHWLRHQPDAFHVHRRCDTDEPAGFLTRLRFGPADERLAASDPVTAAAWEHTRHTAPLRDGEHIEIARFIIDPVHYQRPSAILDLALQRLVGTYLTAAPAWTYTLWSDPSFWDELMTYSQHESVATLPQGGLYGHDWRSRPLSGWLAAVGAEDLFGRRPDPDGVPAGGYTILSRSGFDTAVRDALRSRRDPQRTSENPLLGTRLVAEHPEPDPVAALDLLLHEAVERLGRESEALRVTYFDDLPSQEAAAARLRLPMTTYRRHVTRATERVADRLWAQETATHGEPGVVNNE
ncbi:MULTISPECIES: ATP-binding protein [Actinoplanes]|uniref:ATP-binding protein n=1 Tax=Actinoplanes TaxID=1865 RepID=UPI0012F8FB93|nr:MULTISPECIES: ATP-binding protein [Actinoplanes]